MKMSDRRKDLRPREKLQARGAEGLSDYELTIEAIIFDCFGVLVTETSNAFRDKFFCDQPEFAREMNDMVRAVDLGFLTKPDFHQRLSQMSGMSTGEIFRLLEGGSALNSQMINFVRELKPRYKIGMLSNISPNGLDRFFTEETSRLFDAMALSSEIGYVKPDKRAYLVASDRLGVSPENCLFIDDQEQNIAGAEATGMTGVLFTGYHSLVDDLKIRDILP